MHDFTVDWTTPHFSVWKEKLAPLRDRKTLRVLEVGSWEGRSALFWLEYFPQSHVTCVDTFTGSAEQFAVGHSADGVETRFDRNVSPYAQRTRKIKARSALALPKLAEEEATFDLMYIDGSHLRNDVMVDSLLAWPMLADGGYIIWDDYYYGNEDRSLAKRPQQAIDLFIEWHGRELVVIDVGSQVIATRVANAQPDQIGIVHSRTLANLFRFMQRRPMGDARGARRS
jgi:predicted O-methyltransferase YrrM